MTFSLIGRSPDGSQLGVAVASKFLAVGAYVPAAAVGAGAIATQAYGNQAIRSRGIDMLREGMSAAAMVNEFLADDPQKEERQVGVVDAQGETVTFTGKNCLPWAGGKSETRDEGSYAAQGNMLAGPQVVDAMVDAWLASATEPSLARRLVTALAAGQSAGGDPRGKQAAAVYVVAKGAGYGGLSDVAVDLRCDDGPEPIDELLRMLDIHDLYFGTTPADELLPFDEPLIQELRSLLAKLHFSSGDAKKDLYQWMGRENYEERWYDDAVDPVVLKQLRRA